MAGEPLTNKNTEADLWIYESNIIYRDSTLIYRSDTYTDEEVSSGETVLEVFVLLIHN